MPNPYEPYIRRVPYFANLSPQLLEVVASTLQQRRYAPGEFIFQQGGYTSGLYILLEGEAVLLQQGEDGLTRTLGRLEAGRFINNKALLQEGREAATLKVTQPSLVLHLPRQTFVMLQAQYPELGQAMGLGNMGRVTQSDKRFKGQRDNEHILLFTHRHPWRFLRWGWIPLLLMLACWVLAAVLQPLALVFIPLSLVIPGVIFVYLYVEWVNDDFIITDQRIIRIVHNLVTFSEWHNEVLLDSVQEANAEIPPFDPFAHLFRYGNIAIKTAGDAGNFVMDFIPDPEQIQRLIMYDRTIRRDTVQAREKQAVQQEVARMIGGVPAPPTATKPKNMPTQRSGSFLEMSFPTEDGGIVYRKHWIVWLRAAALPGIVLLAAVFLGILNLFNPYLQSLGVITWFVWLPIFLFGIVWFFYADWDWRHDYFVVRDSIITIIHQRPLWLQNEKDQVILKQVDNVVAETHGILARMLGYGTIKLSLVGADNYKMFDHVPRPLEVQADITQRQARIKRRDQDAADQAWQQKMGDYLNAYHQMMGGTPMMPPQQGQYPPQTPTQGYPPAQSYPQQGYAQPSYTNPAQPYINQQTPPQGYPPYTQNQQNLYPNQQSFTAQGAQPGTPQPTPYNPGGTYTQPGTHYQPPANQPAASGGIRPPRVPGPRPTITPGKPYQPAPERTPRRQEPPPPAPPPPTPDPRLADAPRPPRFPQKK